MRLSETSLWGLSPVHLHDRFWASRGVQVVRQGDASEIVRHAELFLLTDLSSLALFSLRSAVDVLCWTKPRLLVVRLQDRRERGYRERALAGADGQFISFQRLYGSLDSRLTRVALTSHRDLARAWQCAASPRDGWQHLRLLAGRRERHVISVSGNVYDRNADQELLEFTRRLVHLWDRPDTTVGRAVRHDAAVWADVGSRVAPTAKVIGPLWVGAGRSVVDDGAVIGPGVLWDAPESRPAVESLHWENIEPTGLPDRAIRPLPTSSLRRATKRAFDTAFALLALLATLPFYPIVMFLIWIEDGRPFFFTHRRETRGGREFSCIKFRSMRREAEQIKLSLAAENQADGPQFFLNHDPRLTRVGRILRHWNIDELPQFINVLLGDMSVVGPRPSPRRENQFCPPWRDARLSVLPGVTGLWQVMRTRRPGTDFQEWIKYDIEYVETANWRLDLWIICQTLRVII
jgi:lipopolysaccharide/colanic/teichoic acid biosynthesis glycosyltransferase